MAFLLWYLRVGLLLSALWAVLRLGRRVAFQPRPLAAAARVLVIGALLLPVLSWPAAVEPGWAVPAQVFSPPSGVVVDVSLPVASAAPVRVPVRWLSLPAAGALLGGLTWLVWLVVSYRALRRVVDGAPLLHRLGRVEVRRGEAAFAAVLGRRAVVMLPSGSADEAAALLHELTHLRRRDPHFGWLMLAVSGLYCWLPPVWWLRALLSELDEEACDAVVGGRLGARRYGRALLEGAARALAPALAPGMSQRGTLYRRIEMLTMQERPRRVLPFAGAVALLLCGLSWGTESLATDHRLEVADLEVLDVPGAALTLPADEALTERLNAMLSKQKLRTFLDNGMVNRGAYRALVDGALDEAGLPAALAAVPLVESGYANLGAPDAGGSGSLAPGIPGRGLWMFIPSTARVYDLVVEEGRDDRLDPVAETDAAVRLLADLHDEFGDWWLALAGYNQGAGHVRAAIKEAGTSDPWALRRDGYLNVYIDHIALALLAMDDPALVR